MARAKLNRRAAASAVARRRFRFKYVWVFLVPSVALILTFYFIPVVLTFLISLTDMDYSFEWNWVGLKNYIDFLYKDPWIPKILGNTLFYVFVTLIVFNTGLALLVSLLTTHINEKVGASIRSLWLLPRITPSTVYALLWLWATREEPNSLFNWTLGLFGFEPINWRLEQPWLIVILVNGFVGVSFGMIIFTAALKSISNDVIWAAKIDGANTLQQIRYVELPMIKWPILFVITYQTLSLLASYEYILLTTGGGPGLFTTEVWALYIFDLAFRQYGGVVKFGYGAALAVLLVILGVTLSIIYLRIFRFRELMTEPKIEVS